MKNRKIPGSLLLTLLILAFVMMTAQMMARYVNGTGGEGQARVAAFQVNSDLSSFEKTIEAKLSPGNQKEYLFEVENSSETAVEVAAQLFSEGNLPLRISYKIGDGEEQILTENLQTDWQNIRWTDLLKPGAKQNYTLVLHWPDENNGSQHEGGVLALRLRVNVQQTD